MLVVLILLGTVILFLLARIGLLGECLEDITEAIIDAFSDSDNG